MSLNGFSHLLYLHFLSCRQTALQSRYSASFKLRTTWMGLTCTTNLLFSCSLSNWRSNLIALFIKDVHSNSFFQLCLVHFSFLLQVSTQRLYSLEPCVDTPRIFRLILQFEHVCCSCFFKLVQNLHTFLHLRVKFFHFIYLHEVLRAIEFNGC